MQRREFLQALALFPLAAGTMKLQDLSDITGNTPKMPVLFIGHGSPMNGIEDNIFSQQWAKLGKDIPLPSAVLCVSAHWLPGARISPQ